MAIARAIATRCFSTVARQRVRIVAIARGDFSASPTLEMKCSARSIAPRLSSLPLAVSANTILSRTVFHGEQLIEFLKHERAIRARPSDLAAGEEHLPLDRLHVAADRFQQRRLAAARRPSRTTYRSDFSTSKLTRYVAVTSCSPLRYCSVTPFTERRGAISPRDGVGASELATKRHPGLGAMHSTNADYRPGRARHESREREVAPRLRLVSDGADRLHERRVLLRVLRRRRELDVGRAQNLDELLDGEPRGGLRLEQDLRSRVRIAANQLGRFLERAENSGTLADSCRESLPYVDSIVNVVEPPMMSSLLSTVWIFASLISRW